MVRMIYHTSPIWHPPHQTLGAQHVTIANRTSSDGGLGGDTAGLPPGSSTRHRATVLEMLAPGQPRGAAEAE